MDVAVEQGAAHAFPGAAFEQDIVGNHDGSAPADLEDGADVLDEVQLLVAGSDVLAVHGEGLPLLVAFLRARPLPEQFGKAGVHFRADYPCSVPLRGIRFPLGSTA